MKEPSTPNNAHIGWHIRQVLITPYKIQSNASVQMNKAKALKDGNDTDGGGN